MLDGKIALVTGAASGIGEATARRFAREGATLVLVDLKRDEGERVLHDLERDGTAAIFVECNVSDSDSVERAFAAAVEKFGRVDIVFANAGIGGVWAPIEELLPHEWDRTIETNLRGTFLTVHHAIPHMKASGGSVIITSSFSGNRVFAQPGAAAYSTSKAAQVAFMKMAALELARYGIRVNAVCPGGIRTHIGESVKSRHTETIPLPTPDDKQKPVLHGGTGEPADVADTCLFLASDLSRHVTGVEIYVDGGDSLLH
jgi:NAD(P)-dependent dehydrogenase (short-subunit alcohol dehydrogenase family)